MQNQMASTEQVSHIAQDACTAIGAEPLKKLVIIIPAFNEEERIAETVSAVRALERSLRADGMELKVYVIDDGSGDRTREYARLAGADRVLRHRVNQGLGAAVRTGLAAARTDGADIVVKFDADLQHDPEDIRHIVEPILKDEADIVYGNRFNKIEYHMPPVRKVGNLVFTNLMKWLTKWPLRDSQPGIFGAHKAYLEVFYLPGDYNYTQQILLDAFHKGMRFAHCDVSFRKRTTGSSFISFRYPFKVLPQIFMVVVGVKPMKIFAPLGAFFLLLGTAIFATEIVLWMLGGPEKPVMHVNAVLGSIMVGMQALMFGVLAQLVIDSRRR